MPGESKSWCESDSHELFEHYVDFNDWLDGDEALSVREANNVDGISVPSKAFYAGDKEAYDQIFQEYRANRRRDALCEECLRTNFRDAHWFERNQQRFDQLVERVSASAVVPFIGAGISVSAGFPTWEEHLRSQGRTAGIDSLHVTDLLTRGEYESVVDEIETTRGRAVFVQEVRDTFTRAASPPDVVRYIAELFTDTLITTNYDRLIEQAFDNGSGKRIQILSGTSAVSEIDPRSVTVVKLHGDIKFPSECILSKNQYNHAYGNDHVDVRRPIPRLLKYFYENSSLLFLGCSLRNDRTARVFRAIKENLGDADLPQHFAVEEVPETESQLADRNAYLLDLGITGIWFERARFTRIEDMLLLARDELRYNGLWPRYVPSPDETSNKGDQRPYATWLDRLVHRVFGDT